MIVFLVGLGVLLYPFVNEWRIFRAQNRAVAAYDEAAEDLDEEDDAACLEAARPIMKCCLRLVH
ncbi:MAG: hypothetical protein LUE63_02000 [Lachnospiraceae bacterium]|nr:hypothetical protein [Lachnospiraceae bacterium]